MDEFGNLCGEGGARRSPSIVLFGEIQWRIRFLPGPFDSGFGVRASAHVRLHEVSDNEAMIDQVFFGWNSHAQVWLEM